MFARSRRVFGVGTELEVLGAFGAGALGARTIDDLCIPYVRLGVGYVGDDTHAESLDDAVVVHMT